MDHTSVRIVIACAQADLPHPLYHICQYPWNLCATATCLLIHYNPLCLPEAAGALLLLRALNW
jgi:hypothetical protein